MWKAGATGGDLPNEEGTSGGHTPCGTCHPPPLPPTYPHTGVALWGAVSPAPPAALCPDPHLCLAHLRFYRVRGKTE